MYTLYESATVFILNEMLCAVEALLCFNCCCILTFCQVALSRVEEDETMSDSSGDEESVEGVIPSVLRSRVRGQGSHVL